MGEAFTAVLDRFEALGRGNPPKDSIAAFIINLASNGEREAHRMTVTALSHFLGKESSADEERKQA